MIKARGEALSSPFCLSAAWESSLLPRSAHPCFSSLPRNRTDPLSFAYREVYTIVKGAGVNKKDRWVRIGVAFTNKDGSEDVQLWALPTNSRLQLRSPKPRGASEEQS